MTKSTELIPVTLLTGFLGSGKTTALNVLVRHPEMARTLVIINEFGQIGLDHLLVTHSAEDIVVEMSSGCLCCTIRGDLVKTLRDAVWRFSRGGVRQFDRVVIETTGLADPAPVLHTLMADRFVSTRYRLDGVVTTVDLAAGSATLDAHPEAVKQAAVADALLLTKPDLAAPEQVRALQDRLAVINPGACQHVVENGAVSPLRVLNLGLFDVTGKSPDVQRWLQAEAYAEPHMHGDHEHGHHHGSDHAHGHGHAHQVQEPEPHARSEGHGRGEHEHGHGREEAHDRRKGYHHDHRHHHDVNRHDDHIRAFSFAVDEPIDPVVLEAWLEIVLTLMGPNMLRMKAVLNVQGQAQPVVLHGVQHILHPPAVLPAWPSDNRRSQWVFITRDIDRSMIEQSLRRFMQETTTTSESVPEPVPW